MGTGNLKPTDRFIVRVSSDIYGEDEHGPYASLDEAREARARLKLAADVLNDGVDRVYEIILFCDCQTHAADGFGGPKIAEPSSESPGS